MKYALIFIGLSAFALATEAAEIPAPESITMEVSFSPSYAENNVSCNLTDDDHNGTYEVSLSIPKGDEFISIKIVSTDKNETPTSETTWGIKDVRSPFIYGDVAFEADLFNRSELSHDPAIIEFLNWKGGNLEVSLKWDNYIDGVHSPLLTLTAPNQPDYGIYPDKIYLIGNFNDFGLPDSSGNNGAIELRHTAGAKSLRFEGNINLTTSEGDFLIYIPEIAHDTEVFLGLPLSFPITLYKYPSTGKAYFAQKLDSFHAATGSMISSKGHILLKDWQGGEIDFLVDLEYNSAIVITSADAPALDIPENLTAFIKTDDNVESTDGFFSPYLKKFTQCESWLSLTGNDVAVSDEIWGSPADEVIDLSNRPVYPDYEWIVPISKGGYPLKFTCGKAAYASLSVYYDVYNGYAHIISDCSGDSSVAAIVDANHKIVDGSIVLDKPEEIAIYTTTGICMATSLSDRFDLTSLSHGIYILRIGEKTQKIKI